MSLLRPHTPHQAVRLLAAVVTVVLILLLGSLGSSDPDRPAYRHYVALGDSFSAAPFVPLTDVAAGCYRSSNNYPHLVATALHVEDLQDRSCSGAQTSDTTGRQVTSRGIPVSPQFDALSAQTDLVTVGLGANNDHLYAQIATVCRRMKTVCRLYDKRDALGEIVDRLRPALTSTLDEVQSLAPRARVLLVGYPKLLPATGTCARLPRFRAQDRRTFRDINLRMRQQMIAAADDAGAEFIDFYAASLGHDVCSRHPWVQGRTGNRRRAAALHPLPAGQSALARLIEQTLREPPPSTEN